VEDRVFGYSHWEKESRRRLSAKELWLRGRRAELPLIVRAWQSVHFIGFVVIADGT
jgi:hypothetical protein